MPLLQWLPVMKISTKMPARLPAAGRRAGPVAWRPDAGNMLIQGDNLEALKSVLSYYAGKVKCIFIDPPYNTHRRV